MGRDTDFYFFMKEMGMNNNDRNKILNAHNTIRNWIANGQVRGQPRSCNMKRMVSVLKV